MAQLSAAPPSALLRFSLPLSYALLVTVNTLSSMGYLGPSQGDVSGKYRTSLVPAAYAFSIWGVIFTLQGAGALYAALPMGYQLASKCAAVNAVAVGWQLTWLFETAWLLLFPRQTTATFYLSAVLLFAGLACICWTALRTYALVTADPPVGPGLLVWTLYVLPTSMNAAWMSVASCLGLDVLAVSQGIPANNEVTLAAVLAIVAAGVGAFVVLQRRDVAWGGVLVWAFVAVFREHADNDLIRTLALVAVGVAGACSAYVWVVYAQARRRAGAQCGSAAAARLEGGGAAAAAGLQQALLGPGGSGGQQAAA